MLYSEALARCTGNPAKQAEARFSSEPRDWLLNADAFENLVLKL